MAALPPPPRRRRRRGSIERPINARTYRGTWLLVGIPLLIAAFSVSQPTALPRASLPPSFDAARALTLARDLAGTYPDRRPGTDGSVSAADWVSRQLQAEGFQPARDSFVATLPDVGRARLVNVAATAPGRSPDAIVVIAHRDATGAGPGADDNASGTAALLELARAYGGTLSPGESEGRRDFAEPAHTLIFLSTDGGAYGPDAAERFLDRRGQPPRIVATVNLDAIARRVPPKIQLGSNEPRFAPAALVETASARVAAQTGRSAETPGVLAQLIDLGFPFNLYEHAPFVGRGIPAITLTTAGDRPPDATTDTPRRLDRRTLGQLGRSAHSLIGSLDQAAEVTRGTASYLYFGSRIVPGWAVELVLIAALLPFLIAAVDVFAHCRRRRISVAPAFRSYRRRLFFWLWVAGVFALFALTGVFGDDDGGPPPPGLPGAGDWPVVAVAGLAALSALGWLVARERLLPRRRIAAEEELAGSAAALLALGIAALVVAAVNPFALLFVLPSLHVWLWLPQLRHAGAGLRTIVFLGGFAGPVLLLGSFALRFRLGLDAPWYVAQLVADGRVPLPLVAAFLAWLAAGGQLAAISAGRYAPYPHAAERPPRGPFREAVRRIAMPSARRHRAVPARRRAAG